MIKTNKDIEKYKKIMARANSTNFPQERIIALKKAQKILGKKEVSAPTQNFNHDVRGEVAMLGLLVSAPMIMLFVLLTLMLWGVLRQ